MTPPSHSRPRIGAGRQHLHRRRVGAIARWTQDLARGVVEIVDVVEHEQQRLPASARQHRLHRARRSTRAGAPGTRAARRGRRARTARRARAAPRSRARTGSRRVRGRGSCTRSDRARAAGRPARGSATAACVRRSDRRRRSTRASPSSRPAQRPRRPCGSCRRRRGPVSTRSRTAGRGAVEHHARALDRLLASDQRQRERAHHDLGRDLARARDRQARAAGRLAALPTVGDRVRAPARRSWGRSGDRSACRRRSDRSAGRRAAWPSWWRRGSPRGTRWPTRSAARGPCASLAGTPSRAGRARCRAPCWAGSAPRAGACAGSRPPSRSRTAGARTASDRGSRRPSRGRSARRACGRAPAPGDMYSGVPHTIPAVVSPGSLFFASISLAMPKSSTTASSPWVRSCWTRMFSGLRSRWRMPSPCASLSAARICSVRSTMRSRASGNCSAINPLERDARDVLHHDVRHALGGAPVVDDRNAVGMVEAGGVVGLGGEPARGSPRRSSGAARGS